jgi:hypothetical protein
MSDTEQSASDVSADLTEAAVEKLAGEIHKQSRFVEEIKTALAEMNAEKCVLIVSAAERLVATTNVVRDLARDLSLTLVRVGTGVLMPGIAIVACEDNARPVRLPNDP